MLEESVSAALQLAGERFAVALRQKLADYNLTDSLLIDVQSTRVVISSRARDVSTRERGMPGQPPNGLFEATARDHLPAIMDEVRDALKGGLK